MRGFGLGFEETVKKESTHYLNCTLLADSRIARSLLSASFCKRRRDAFGHKYTTLSGGRNYHKSASSCRCYYDPFSACRMRILYPWYNPCNSASLHISHSEVWGIQGESLFHRATIDVPLIFSECPWELSLHFQLLDPPQYRTFAVRQFRPHCNTIHFGAEVVVRPFLYSSSLRGGHHLRRWSGWLHCQIGTGIDILDTAYWRWGALLS